ncbi:MAG: Asp23/Gls24 family envelope stress response protein [Coriobacteriales bacterium]|nr:Asp23/Gls24 family envelope stress response protein [Coriobacteriales bacterium]
MTEPEELEEIEELEEQEELIDEPIVEEPIEVVNPEQQNQEIQPSQEYVDESTLSIENNVVEKIVAITCRSVDGILQMKGNLISSIQENFGGTDLTKGVQVEMVGEDACSVSVSIIMEFGKSAPRIFQELHDKICETITNMTGLRVNAVNVRIVNVMTREEMESGRRKDREDKVQDKKQDKKQDK